MGVCRFCAGETAASFTASGQVKPRGLLWNLSAARRLHPTTPPLYDASPGRAWRNLPRVNFCLPRGFILIIQISGVKLILWLGSRERLGGGGDVLRGVPPRVALLNFWRRHVPRSLWGSRGDSQIYLFLFPDENRIPPLNPQASPLSP